MSFILPGGLGQIAVVSGGPPSTLDPATIGGSSIGVLSSGNMVFTATAQTQSMVSGTRFRNSGKFYFEFQMQQASGASPPLQVFGAGIISSNGVYYNIGGGGQWSIVQDNNTSQWYTMNNSTLGTVSPGTPNIYDCLQFALDMTSTTNARFYLGVNNVWFPTLGPFSAASPTFSGLGAGVGYTYYPTCSVGTTSGTNLPSWLFINKAPFTYTPPAGFSPWN